MFKHNPPPTIINLGDSMNKKYILLNLVGVFILLLFALTFSQPVYALSKNPERITVTFYNEEANSRGFNWVTDPSVSDGTLQIIEKTNQEPNDINWNEAQSIPATGKSFYIGFKSWKAHVVNLTYNKTYYYRVGSPAANIWSTVGVQLITDASDGVRFTHLTDPQSYTALEYEKWTNTINIIDREFPKVNAMLMTGDLTQEYSNPGANINEWGYALNGPKDWFMNNVISPAAGNHDKSADMFNNHFNMQIPNDQDTSKGVYYTYKIQDVQVFILNTNDELTTTTPLAQKQKAWLENELSQSTALWKIVGFHHGVVTTGRHMLEADIELLRNDLMPLFAAYNVDLVVQGHDHVIARSKPYAWSGNGKVLSTVQPTITQTVNHHAYQLYEAPGTFYVIQNMATARAAALSPTQAVIDFPSFFNIEYSPVNGKLLNQQPNVPSFGYITIKDGTLIYETYILDQFKDLVLYDYFGVSKNSAEVVSNLIEKLPNTYTQAINKDLAYALNRYNQLTPSDQNKIDVSLVQKMNNLAKNISLDDFNAALEVTQMINQLGKVSASSTFLDQLNLVIAAYENLTNIGKFYVNNHDILLEVEVKYQAKIAALVISQMIEQLKVSETITRDDVVAVRSAYDQISNEAKMFVANYFDLATMEASFGIYHRQKVTS